MKGKRGWGAWGEEYAAKLLTGKGYRIVEKNFRCMLGEIDIVAIDNDTLVFVEVKTRWSRKFGLPEEAVNERKLYKIRRVADFYLLQNKSALKKQRIDVVAIQIENNQVNSAKIIKVI